MKMSDFVCVRVCVCVEFEVLWLLTPFLIILHYKFCLKSIYTVASFCLQQLKDSYR